MVDVKTLATECRNKVLAKQLIDILCFGGGCPDFHYGTQKLLLILLLLSLLTESAVIIEKISDRT